MAVITVPGHINAAVVLACGAQDLLHSFLRQLPASDLHDLSETIGLLYIAITEACVDAESTQAYTGITQRLDCPHPTWIDVKISRSEYWRERCRQCGFERDK